MKIFKNRQSFSMFLNIPIIFIGNMGSGKSVIGRNLAKKVLLPFFDADSLIAQKYGAISEIFAQYNENYFRKIEFKIIKQVIKKYPEKGFIFSLGGGAIENKNTRKILTKNKNIIVFLNTNLKTVKKRLFSTKNRPMLKNDSIDFLKSWSHLMNKRKYLYKDLADIIVDVSFGDIKYLVEKTYELLIKKIKSI